LGFGSYDTALFITTLLGIVVMAIASARSLSYLRLYPEWLSRTKGILLLFSFLPFLRVVWFGQLAWITFGSLILFLELQQRGLRSTAGVVLSLLLIKPHLWIAVFGFIIAASLRRRSYTVLCGLLFGGMAQLIASWSVYPFDLKGFINCLSLTPHGDAEKAIVTAAPFNILVHLTGIAALPALGIACGVLYGIWRERSAADAVRDGEEIVMRLAPVSLLCAPYAWLHDYVALFPAVLAWILGKGGARSEQLALRWWTLGTLCCAAALTLNAEPWCVLLLIPALTPQRTAAESVGKL
jgi:hypothetical protein